MFVDQLENIFMSQCEVNFKGLSIALVIGVPDKEDHMLQSVICRPLEETICSHRKQHFAKRSTQMV